MVGIETGVVLVPSIITQVKGQCIEKRVRLEGWEDQKREIIVFFIFTNRLYRR